MSSIHNRILQRNHKVMLNIALSISDILSDNVVYSLAKCLSLSKITPQKEREEIDVGRDSSGTRDIAVLRQEIILIFHS